MRKEKAIKNATASAIKNIVTIIIGFIAQSIFIKTLGSEYLGINSLFNNIISMLNIAELGFGTAIIYNLYRPLAEKNYEKIKSLLYFYKKIYIYVSLFIAVGGIIIVPFLSNIVGNITINDNIYIIYLLFLITSASSYLLSYKRSIIYADQKNYIIEYAHLFYYFLINALQILVLILSKNFYLYLIIKLIFTIIENITITYFANVNYPYLKEKEIDKLDKNTINDIKTKVKALLLHKVGSFIVLGTDNILISKFFGVVKVGLYANYYLIISSVNRLFGQAIQTLIPSIGNLAVTENKEKNFDIFKKIRFINFWIGTFTACSIAILMKDFIAIWVGKEFILDELVLIVLAINYFQDIMRNTYVNFFTANGIYYENRFVPIAESIVNIAASIVLLKIFGLAGVFMGTIVSSLCLWAYSFPKYLYHGLFKKSYKKYALSILHYLALFLIILFATYFVSQLIKFDNTYLTLTIKALYCLIVPNIIITTIFNKSENYRYMIKLLLEKAKLSNRKK